MMAGGRQLIHGPLADRSEVPEALSSLSEHSFRGHARRYLSGVDAAEAITERMLQVYSRHGVVPLVESSVQTEQELRHVQQLLQKGYGPSTSS